MSAGTPGPASHSDSRRPQRLSKLPPGDKSCQLSAANRLSQTRSARRLRSVNLTHEQPPDRAVYVLQCGRCGCFQSALFHHPLKKRQYLVP